MTSDRPGRPARDRAIALAWRLSSLPELAMRRAVLAEACAATEPRLLAEILHELVVGARVTPGPPFTSALETLAVALDDSVSSLGYEARGALYEAAKTAGHHEVARLLFGAAPHARLTEPAPPDPEQAVLPGTPAGDAGGPAPREATASAARVAPTTPGALRGKPLTLGERKALARGRRRELLDRLVRDPDAAVVRVVLENPLVTERDVLTIAARRPARADVLRAVFESRWLSRYRVKRALVMNPYTPSDVAVRLVATLTLPDLRAVAADGGLGAPVREQARSLMALAGARPGPDPGAGEDD